MQTTEREKTGVAFDEVKIPVDPVNEQIVLAGMLVDEPTRTAMVRRLMPDYFQVKEHKAIFAALQETVRRKLAYDIGTLRTLAKNVDVDYVSQLIEARPSLAVNYDYHVKALLWDFSRANTATGPLNAFVEALRDQLAEPERVRSLAKQVYESITENAELKYLRDPAQIVDEQMAAIEARGKVACYSYGIADLDFYETPGANGERIRRMVPGAAPGQITVVTAISGAGKSTIALQMALGLVRQGRRPVIGTWEQTSKTSLEILTCMVLGWSRSYMLQGKSPSGNGKLTLEDLTRFRLTMGKVAKRIRFIDNPFNRNRGEQRNKNSNDRNLDLLQAYLEAAGCDVFIADLWKRSLRNAMPEDEEDAIVRQQAMFEELQIHGILLHQQRFKDIEQRENKRPTREGIKGSGAFVEVADTIIGVHRPCLWTGVDDSILELDVLKARYGIWPLTIQFAWNVDSGNLGKGITIPYDNGSVQKDRRGIGSFFKGKN